MNLLLDLLPESWMERHRGKRGFFGWLVLRADVRWLKRHVDIAKRIAK